MDYITIDKTIKKALYLQIKDCITEAIKQGILSDNDRLPTESELCEVFGISDIVVKNAYKLLVKQGLIIRVQGSGTYVSTRKIFKFPLKGFDRINDFSHYRYYEKEKHIILFDVASDHELVMDMLGLTKDESYYVAKYVVSIDRAEVMLQTLYLPKKLYPLLVMKDIELNTLPELISKKYARKTKRITNGFSPVNLSSSEAMLLNTYKGAAAHRVRTMLYAYKDQKIAFMETLFLGEYTQFEVVLG
ncbi:MAG: GntR family transcriptional regulator [Acholeplasmataceae bacterium]